MTDTVTASVKLTDYLMSQVDELVEKGIFVNRSEAIREAIRLMINSQFGIMKGKAGKTQITEKDRAHALKVLAASEGLRL
jgi:Arc/MetJ-type ribon-helix-helix transcriptional regulator